eukprot:7136887-Prymnesium_polylepis.1
MAQLWGTPTLARTHTHAPPCTPSPILLHESSLGGVGGADMVSSVAPGADEVASGEPGGVGCGRGGVGCGRGADVVSRRR